MSRLDGLFWNLDFDALNDAFAGECSSAFTVGHFRAHGIFFFFASIFSASWGLIMVDVQSHATKYPFPMKLEKPGWIIDFCCFFAHKGCIMHLVCFLSFEVTLAGYSPP